MDYSKNNDTDIKAYEEFMKRQQKLARRRKESLRDLRIEKNLEEWGVLLEHPWDKADMKYFTGRPVDLVNAAIKNRKLESFIVLSDKEGGKTFFTYALIKEYIKEGLVTPSEIRKTDIREGISHINGMYKSKDWKDNFFDKDAKLLVVEGCSADFTNLNLRNQDQFWNEVFKHCEENKKALIVTYTTNAYEEEGDIIIPALTQNKEFNVSVVMNSKVARVSEETRNKDLNRVK